MDDQQSNRALTSALRRATGLAAADVDVRDCVDAERLAAWSSGALSTDEAAEVERHLRRAAVSGSGRGVRGDRGVGGALAAPVRAGVKFPHVDGAARRGRCGRALVRVAASQIWSALRLRPARRWPVCSRAPRRRPRRLRRSDRLSSPPAPSTGADRDAGRHGRRQAGSERARRCRRRPNEGRRALGPQPPPGCNERADPKAAPPQGAQPSTAPPAPAIPPPVAAPVPVSTPTPVRRTAASYRSAGRARAAPPPAPTAPPPTAAREFRAPALRRGARIRARWSPSSAAQRPLGWPAGSSPAPTAAAEVAVGQALQNRQIAIDAVAVTAAVPHWRVLASRRDRAIDRWRGASLVSRPHSTRQRPHYERCRADAAHLLAGRTRRRRADRPPTASRSSASRRPLPPISLRFAPPAPATPRSRPPTAVRSERRMVG